MFVDFMGVCFDQIFNQAAKFRYMFGGKAVTPVVIRTMYGAGFRAASQHSQCLYPLFTHIPGLKVVLPSNPYEAKGLMIQAIRDDDPVIVFEHKTLYDVEGEVPDEPYVIPFGEANVTREGRDVTIITMGRMVNFANEAADNLAKSGVEDDSRRPSHDLAARSRNGAGDCAGDGPRGRGGRGPPAVLDGYRHRGAGGGRNLWFAESARQNGDRAARSGAVLAGAGGHLYSVGGEDRGGRARGHGIFARQGRGVGPVAPRAIPRR